MCGDATYDDDKVTSTLNYIFIHTCSHCENVCTGQLPNCYRQAAAATTTGDADSHQSKLKRGRSAPATSCSLNTKNLKQIERKPVIICSSLYVASASDHGCQETRPGFRWNETRCLLMALEPTLRWLRTRAWFDIELWLVVVPYDGGTDQKIAIPTQFMNHYVLNPRLDRTCIKATCKQCRHKHKNQISKLAYNGLVHSSPPHTSGQDKDTPKRLQFEIMQPGE